jgi:hypothetical protein
MILLTGECHPVLPDTDDGGDDTDLEASAFKRPALLDVGFEIADMAPALDPGTRTTRQTHLSQRLPHGAVGIAIPCGVDIRLGHVTNIRPATEEMAEMSFLIAPCCDFNGAADGRVGVDDAGGFQCVDHAKRAIKPAGKILTFEMRSREQFRPTLRACAENVADTVDLGHK